jgi:hypothetical protein
LRSSPAVCESAVCEREIGVWFPFETLFPRRSVCPCVGLLFHYRYLI